MDFTGACLLVSDQPVGTLFITHDVMVIKTAPDEWVNRTIGLGVISDSTVAAILLSRIRLYEPWSLS